MVALESWQALRCCLLWRCCFLLQEWLHRSCLDQGISFALPVYCCNRNTAATAIPACCCVAAPSALPACCCCCHCVATAAAPHNLCFSLLHFVNNNNTAATATQPTKPNQPNCCLSVCFCEQQHNYDHNVLQVSVSVWKQSTQSLRILCNSFVTQTPISASCCKTTRQLPSFP